MAGRLIPVRVGDIEIEIETVRVSGTEATSGGRVAQAADSAADAFERAQDAIAQVARSTAKMIERAGPAARPDRVDVKFGLGFSATGGVIMARVAGEATLKVTLSYGTTAHPAAAHPATAHPAAARPAAGEPAPAALPAPSVPSAPVGM